MSCIIYKDGEQSLCEAVELSAMLAQGWSVEPYSIKVRNPEATGIAITKKEASKKSTKKEVADDTTQE